MPTESDRASTFIAEPASAADIEDGRKYPEKGSGLCLSGGGYRAMLFHLGTFWRLCETGLLEKQDRISSVSGGSIVSALLGIRWKAMYTDPSLALDRFRGEVVPRILRLAGKTIDVKSILSGLFWFGSISDKVAKAYRKNLYGDATLQDLPDEPRFVINASNVQTGVLWRFSKPYMGDWKVGLTKNPDVELAVAVGASSAFPPVLSPATIDLGRFRFEKTRGATLNRPPYTTRAVLSDGGVYDNMGLETVFKRLKTVLVSNAGMALEPQGDPARDWGRHSYRVLGVIDNQVRALRKRSLIEAYRQKERSGAYWGIRADIARYSAPDTLPCPIDRTTELARIPTRLAAMDPRLQERLVNWGYAVTDAAVRTYVDRKLDPPERFPYPAVGV